jgi:ubiquinone/menaquinone biosynthesis C-methylase UbiE
VSSIDAVDTSEKMLEQARSIVEQLKADPATSTSLPPITFLTASVENLPYPSGSFDTVVDTFGLASYADPAAALREIHRVTRQDGRGRILLLETGRSSEYAWLNKYLETRRVKRLREAASDPTVDVDALVKTLDGKVKVVERRVSMFGTMHAYVLAVPAKRKPDAAAVK